MFKVGDVLDSRRRDMRVTVLEANMSRYTMSCVVHDPSRVIGLLWDNKEQGIATFINSTNHFTLASTPTQDIEIELLGLT